MVNNSAGRKINIDGIPGTVKTFDVYVTDAIRGMQKTETITVKNGKASFVADSQAYYSLFTNN
jgi:hypothetical protein